jgi:hypothetical protein
VVHSRFFFLNWFRWDIERSLAGSSTCGSVVDGDPANARRLHRMPKARLMLRGSIGRPVAIVSTTVCVGRADSLPRR